MAGYPGSGKSTLARKMADFFPAYYLSSDEIRAQMFSSSRYDPIGDSVISKQRDQVYIYLAQTILLKLTEHEKIIVDATNLEESKRQAMLEVLFTKLSPEQICFVTVKTSHKIMAERFRQLDKELFEGWKRVYAIFKQKKKEGLLSWPKYQNISVIAGKEFYAYLDQTT
jgi:predicted kinase